MDWVVQLVLKVTGQDRYPTATASNIQHNTHVDGTQPQVVNGVTKQIILASPVAHTYENLTKQQVIELRKKNIGSACTTFFSADPILVERSTGQYIYDTQGIQYLDCISNVQHVGHCHPEVVAAVAHQMSKANCNMRFLHGALSVLSSKITALLPDPIDTLYMTNSGSEANDLALRLSRDYTGGTDVIVFEHGYHGHLISTINFSHYKFARLPPHWKPDWVHVVAIPDVYRGKHRLPDDQLDSEKHLNQMAEKYADEVKRVIEEEIVGRGRKLAALFMEALVSCGGQVIPPKGYLDRVVEHVHSAGGLVVIDEVQTGFGRAGSKFWAWQSHSDANPDIVTMGKPMGNGFPVAAVATRKQVADVLGRHVEYFNTYGGNPVSCAVALAVLNIIQRDGLQAHAHNTGTYFMQRLRELQTRHTNIGHVRGVGLFLGLDLVTDRVSRQPDTQLAAKLILNARTHSNVLLSAEGPHSNIIKIKPPMCFNRDNVDTVIEVLDRELTALESR